MTDANACTCHEQVMILRTGHHDRSCPSFRPARRTTTCAGCDCEPGTTCDSVKMCDECGKSKTLCDALKSSPPEIVFKDSIVGCCVACSHG